MSLELAVDGERITSFITVGGIDYYVHQAPSHHIISQPSQKQSSTGFDSSRDLYLCSVVNWSKDRFDKESLNAISAELASRDDVWTPAFLDVVVLQTPKDLNLSLGGLGPEVAHVLTEPEASHLPNGPYVVRPASGEMFHISRLFEDSCSAFIGGSVRFSSQFHCFQWIGVEDRIAVPSRLYSERTPTRPLAGVQFPLETIDVPWLIELKLRFAVKDIIDVAGLKTGCGNRSYRELYPNRTRSARCVQKLVDAGAVLVGKTKTTQFAEGEVPTQWIDYLAPFNPRGDMYQKPSSSSTGSAVASATYPWLDFTVGTDTGGSIRHPAGVCGTYGMRPSTGAVSTTGVYSVSPLLDTVGVFARSAQVVEAVIKSMAERNSSVPPPLKPSVKYKLLYPIRPKNTKPEYSHLWFPYPGEPGEAAAAEDIFEDTIRKIESHLKCTRAPFEVYDLWRKTRPAGQDESLDKATGEIYTILTTHSCVRQTIDPFIADYKTANDDRAPFIDSIVKARQDHGRKTTTSQQRAAEKSTKIFSRWVREVLFAVSDDNECPLLIFPQSWGSPDYRDDPDQMALFFNSFSVYSLSYLSGCPDCTVPVGEVPCHSRIAEAEIFLPVSLSVLSPSGTDHQLLALLTDLEKGDVLRPVTTGRRMYGKGK